MGHLSFLVVYFRAPLDVIPSRILQNLHLLICFLGSQIKEEEVEINQKMKVETPTENKVKDDKVEIDPEMEVQFVLQSTEWLYPAQRYDKDQDPEEDKEQHSISADSNNRSASSVRSSTAASLLGYRRRSKSTASSCEEVIPASSVGLASSRGCLSSCSTVIVMEEQLMLNPLKPEVGGRSYIDFFLKFLQSTLHVI